MNIIKTKIPEILILNMKIFNDDRGCFFESYNKKYFSEKFSINNNFVQDNESQSKYGVLRGLHYQLEPYAQTKLVRVLEGKVFDVVVDIRKNSPSYGQWVGVELSEENKLQLFIPKGFAHGFVALTENVKFFYKCDNFYNPQAEAGINFNDSDLKINWQIDLKNIIVNEKDLKLPFLKNAKNNFLYKEKI
jgi:dTDP-4-dehydrorhamnose 3,5-epimerase